MIGTLLNAVGIIAGGLTGLLGKGSLSAANESFFKVLLGAFAVFYGLRLTWLSLNGSFSAIAKQVAGMVLALILGRLVGRLLHLQALSNRIGRAASERIASVRADDPERISKGFKTCAALFCAAPLGIIGALLDGLPLPGAPSPDPTTWTAMVVGYGYAYPLLIKAMMEGLAAMGFARLFGGGVLLSVVPVIAWQGTITLFSARFLEPWLRSHGLTPSIQAVGGLLVFCVALVVLQLKKIELADYLPSLVFAPLIAWVWR